MAKFNPSEAIPVSTSNGKFDPAQAIRASMPNRYQQAANMFAGTQYAPPRQSQPSLIMQDFTEGVGAGLQNPLAYITQKLPSKYQVPSVNPAAQSSLGKIPIEAGKIFASFLPGIGTEKAVTAGLGAVEQIPALVSRIAGGSAGGAASAPSVDASPTTGAILGGVGAAVPEAAMGLLGKYLGRNVTPEEFQAARQAIPKGIKAPIGELANSSGAQKSFAGAQAISLSGADKPYAQLYDHLTQGAKSLTEGAPITDNPNKYIYDDLSNRYESLKENTSNAYDEFSEHADKNKLKFDRGAYDEYLDEHINNFKKEFEESPTSEDIFSGTLSTLENFKKDKIDNFSQANRQRKNIRKKIEKNLSEDKRFDKKILLGARKALDESMLDSSIVNGDSLNKYLAAKSARIEQGKMEHLNDKDSTPFYKIYNKHGTPDTLISSYLKSGKDKDYSGLLSNLTDHISDDGRKVLADAYLNPKQGTTLAQKMTRIGKLSPTQREMLFSEKAPTAHDLSEISSIYGKAKVANFTPKTGFTGSKILQKGATAAGLSAAGAGYAMHNPATVAAALGAAAAIPTYGQVMQRALRSETLKDLYMKYLQHAGKGSLTRATPTGQAARTSAIALMGGNQNAS